jgi:hypothetical protein
MDALNRPASVFRKDRDMRIASRRMEIRIAGERPTTAAILRRRTKQFRNHRGSKSGGPAHREQNLVASNVAKSLYGLGAPRRLFENRSCMRRRNAFAMTFVARPLFVEMPFEKAPCRDNRHPRAAFSQTNSCVAFPATIAANEGARDKIRVARSVCRLAPFAQK